MIGGHHHDGVVDVANHRLLHQRQGLVALVVAELAQILDEDRPTAIGKGEHLHGGIVGPFLVRPAQEAPKTAAVIGLAIACRARDQDGSGLARSDPHLDLLEQRARERDGLDLRTPKRSRDVFVVQIQIGRRGTVGPQEADPRARRRSRRFRTDRRR